MKKFLAVLMSSIMLIGSSNVMAAPNTRYVLNKQEVSIGADFLVQNGAIYLPAIDTFKACGYNVKATSTSITVTAIGKPGYVSIWPGKKTAVLNGQNITLGTAPFFKNGVCYVSSKFIEEQTGVKISYVASAKTLYLDFKNAPKITSTVSKAPASTSSSKSTYSNFSEVPGLKILISDENTTIYENATKQHFEIFDTIIRNQGYIRISNYDSDEGIGYAYTNRAGTLGCLLIYTPKGGLLSITGPMSI